MNIFLSSTYIDLKEHRRAVVEALRRLDQCVIGMEVFGSRAEDPTTACLDEVEACDLFIGLYAHRYGFIPGGSVVSITEQEFECARSLAKPTLCFMVSDDYPWPPKFVEGEPGRIELASLKQRLHQQLVCDTFTSPDDLAAKVATSVGRCLAKSRFDSLALQLRASLGHTDLSSERLAQGNALSEVPDSTRTRMRHLLAELSSMIDQSEIAPARNELVDAETLLTVAKVLSADGNWLEAAEAYEQYSQMRPGNWEAHFLRGVALANTRGGKNNDLASLRSYNDAVTFAPDDIDKNWRARIFCYRAAVLKRLGRLEEAESDLTIARRHATAAYEVNDALYNLAAVYALGGRREELLEVLKDLPAFSEARNSIRAHLDDYFLPFKDDAEFLAIIR